MATISQFVFTNRARLIIIISIFICSRLVFFWLEQNDFLYLLPHQDDAPTYLELSSIYAGHNTYAELGHDPLTRVPLYPLFLSLFSSLKTPAHLIFVFVIQQFVQLSILLSVYIYLAKNYTPKLAFYATCLLSFFYDFTIYGFLIRPETFFSALILTAVLVLLRAITSSNPLFFILSAFCLSIATLTRPIAALSIIPLLAITVYFTWQKTPSLRSLVMITFLTAFIFCLPLMPWFYRNYLLTGKIILQFDTSNLIHATVPGGHWGSVNVHQLIDTTNMSHLEIDQAITTIAVNRIKHHPSIWLKNTLANFSIRLWSMGFADTYLRYLNHTTVNPGGYDKSAGTTLLQRLFSSWNLSNPYLSIHPLYQIYFILNNWLGLLVSVLPLVGLVLFPFLPLPQKIIFILIFYFWFITSFFAFSGSRYMVPMLPLLWLVVPSYPTAVKIFYRSFFTL